MTTWTRTRSFLLGLVAIAVGIPLMVLGPQQLTSATAVTGSREPALRIQVLSNRADLVSAGEALVAVRLP